MSLGVITLTIDSSWWRTHGIRPSADRQPLLKQSPGGQDGKHNRHGHMHVPLSDGVILVSMAVNLGVAVTVDEEERKRSTWIPSGHQ
ncbi:unnamed protein product [Arctogadus glacialis]